MNTINVTVQLCEEDRKLLEALIGSVTLLASAIGNAQTPDVQKKIIEDASEQQAATAPVETVEFSFGLPVEGAAHLEPVSIGEAPPAPEVKPVSLGEFQKALVKRCAESATTKQKVQALVQKYADSVSNIPEEKRPEVLAALAKI